jgi:pilus assembly protein FimV
MFRKTAIAAALLVIGSTGALALGLGDISMKSVLNQPMQAEIDLTSARDAELSEIKVSLASQEAHQRAGLSKSALLNNLKFTVEKTPDGNAVVRVTSLDAIREPFIEFMLQLEWPKGRLLRQYTVLVDPPVTMPAVPVAPPTPVTRAAVPLAEPVPATRIPAPAPIPAVAAPKVVTAVVNAYGPVKRTDTLWSIAEQMRPDNGVSMHQMMQALLRANPDAFVNNNINHMKAGSVLRMPERSEILAMSARAAEAESRRQYAEWQEANESALAGADPAAEQGLAETTDMPGPAESAESMDAASADASAGAATDSGSSAAVETRLSLVAPEGDAISGAAAPGDPEDAAEADVAAADLNQQLTLATEEAVASRAQSEELQSRVSELEQQIDTMKRLLELKDHALAQLQNRVDSDVAVTTTPEAPAEDAASMVSPAPVAAGQSPRDLLSSLTANPLFMGAMAALAALLAGLVWSFVRRRGDADDLEDDLTLQTRLEVSRSREDREEMDIPVVHVREPEAEEEEVVVAGSHDHDPLTEADVFLAYGRIQQAEDTLRAALQAAPGNGALQLKLLEVYHAAGNIAAFERLALDYRAGHQDDDESWFRVADMGHALAPHNDLFAAAAAEVEEDEEIPEFDLTGVAQAGRADAAQDTDPAVVGAAGHDGLSVRAVTPYMSEGLEYALDVELAAEDEEALDGVLASEDEVTTKLDLARAYLDMDDQDSARSILDEVMEEGNLGQKEEAVRIIARLA